METQLDRVRELLRMFEEGEIPSLHQHEVNPGLPKGNRENYLYFTLPVCLNFQRSSPAMWASALKTWQDPETRYLFFPEESTAAPLEKVRADLSRHRLGLQPNKHTEIWRAISATLNGRYGNDPREVMAAAGHDAGKLIRMLQVDRKEEFPYLRGPKLSNYWPYILSQYTDLELANPHEISIIPDTHVIQCSVHLGLVPAGATPAMAEQAWKNLLQGTGISPTTMHPVLWNWSRNRFLPAV